MGYPRSGRAGYTAGLGVLRPQRILLPDGSASSPSLAFADDPDTGITRISTMQLLFGGNSVINVGGLANIASALFTSGLRLTGESAKTGAYNVTSVDALVPTDTSGGAFTATLPSSPGGFQIVYFVDVGGAWDTQNLTLGRNGKNINGAASDFTASTASGWVIAWYDGTEWWVKEI